MAGHRVVVVDGVQVAGAVTAHDQLGRLPYCLGKMKLLSQVIPQPANGSHVLNPLPTRTEPWANLSLGNPSLGLGPTLRWALGQPLTEPWANTSLSLGPAPH